MKKATKKALTPGTQFTINTPSHGNGRRVYVVAGSHGSGITAWDAAEMKYKERNRTIYCIGNIPLKGFIAQKEMTIQEAINEQVRVIASRN